MTNIVGKATKYPCVGIFGLEPVNMKVKVVLLSADSVNVLMLSLLLTLIFPL